jgi:hypothetical protein
MGKERVMSGDRIDFREVFDQQDDNMMRELIVRVAARMQHFSGDRMSPMLSIPMAIQMLVGYLNGSLRAACEINGIDLMQTPAVDGEGYDVHMELKPRN